MNSHHPEDPQHPPDLLSTGAGTSQPPSSFYPQYPSSSAYPPSYGGQWVPQPNMHMVPPELDPPVDATGLDRKTAGHIQQEVAKWVRDTKYNITSSEGSPLLRPIRNLFLGLVGGTIVGRAALVRFFPAFVAGPPIKPWIVASLCAGYPLGAGALYFSQVPAAKAILEQKGPIGIQARYVYRSFQAEKSGMPPPPPPFSMPMMQQPGMAPAWNSPYSQQGQPQPNQQQPPQMMQWNQFQPPPQHSLPPNAPQWGAPPQQPTSGPNGDPRFRSWEEIRKTGHPEGNRLDDPSSSSSEMQ